MPAYTERLIRSLKDDEERGEFVAEQARTRIALQIRALRESCGWSQHDLGLRAKKPQSVISRIENIDAGKGLTLETLLDIGSIFKLPLFVEYAEWDDWLDRAFIVSREEIVRRPFNYDYLINKLRG